VRARTDAPVDKCELSQLQSQNEDRDLFDHKKTRRVGKREREREKRERRIIMCRAFDICKEQDYATPPVVIPHSATQEEERKRLASPSCVAKAEKAQGSVHAIASPSNGDDKSGCPGFGQLKFDAVFLNELPGITSGI